MAADLDSAGDGSPIFDLRNRHLQQGGGPRQAVVGSGIQVWPAANN
jgi:hypothetical protein